jgi:hypothetical protein
VTREQLEHLIRTAADIASDDDIVVVGSRAILGQYPNAPAALRVSAKADVFPKNRPERAELIDGSIGELSPFHATYGYYAQGGSESTAVLPAGWQDRLVVVANANTRGARGHCLEVHDLLVSKAIAGREKDLAFLREAALHRLADEQTILERLDATAIDESQRACVRAAIERAFRETRGG